MRRQRRQARRRALVLGLLVAVGTALALLLARERPAMLREMAALSELSPFKRGDEQG